MVVHYQMQVQPRRRLLVDVAQEVQELPMSMLRADTRDDLAVAHIERSEQRCCAVMNVVVGDAFDVAQSHGQHRLRALQGLNLTLPIDALHQRMIGWVEVQAGDIAHLLDESRLDSGGPASGGHSFAGAVRGGRSVARKKQAAQCPRL